MYVRGHTDANEPANCSFEYKMKQLFFGIKEAVDVKKCYDQFSIEYDFTASKTSE